MIKTLLYDTQKIEYSLKVSKRSKSIRLVVYPDGSVTITLPLGVGERLAEEFIVKKAEWLIDKIEAFKKISSNVIIKHSVKEIKEYKVQAKIIANQRLEYFNQFYNFTWGKISIKNTKSRWGSCSKQGNLNFNYKIALLPPLLRDYIVVHELCHLGELNHSLNFWKLVAQTLPQHKELRKQLKTIS